MRALTTPQVLIGGRWLSSMVMWGDLSVTHRWPYGCWEASWNVIVKPYQRIPAAKAPASVELRMGSGPIWAGNLAEIDWDEGRMTAVGAARQGETTLALSATPDVTATPNTAVDQGIARGALTWTRLASLSATPFGVSDTTERLNYVTALLDAWSTSESKRWGVNAKRVVYAATDPTTPTLYARPGAGVLGVTDETQAARMFGRYENLSGTVATVNVGSGIPEVGVWLGPHGPIDSTKATSIITGMRDQVQARTGWTNGITVTPDKVTTPGGQRIGLDQVVAGKMMRLLGLRDERGASASTDIVLGETIWDVSGDTVQCNPVALDDNSLAGVIEAGGGELL